MKNNSFKEIIVTVCLVIIAILLLNPFYFWMPNMLLITLLATSLILFGFFASFVLRESASDEREGMHRMLAGRNAFLAGSAVLMTGIIVEALEHAVNPWIVLSLVVMIVVKISTRRWTDTHL